MQEAATELEIDDISTKDQANNFHYLAPFFNDHPKNEQGRSRRPCS
jgi:hypothetical protein